MTSPTRPFRGRKSVPPAKTKGETARSVQRAVPGDWLEVAGLPGRPARRGQIVEVLGRSGHEHFRVRWDEDHESVFFPSEATRIVRTRG